MASVVAVAVTEPMVNVTMRPVSGSTPSASVSKRGNRLRGAVGDDGLAGVADHCLVAHDVDGDGSGRSGVRPRCSEGDRCHDCTGRPRRRGIHVAVPEASVVAVSVSAPNVNVS